MAETQQEIFDSLKKLSHDIGNLAAFVQNDFDQMIEEGYTTPDEISKSAEEAARLFDCHVTALSNLRIEVLGLLAKHSIAHRRGTH
jgi:hypothetical protein